MKLLKSFTALAALAFAGAAVAAPNLVTNGGFESGYTFSTEFNDAFNPGNGPTGWTSTGNKAFNLYVDPATVTSVETVTEYSELGQKLALSFPGASPNGGKFVILDGDENFNGRLSQLITGLTVGQKYNVGFSWGASQLQNRSGPTTERIEVEFYGPSQSTPTVAVASQGFMGWYQENFTFTATTTSNVLSFLAHGTPNGLPPVAVLDGVSVTAVPEPAVWGLMVVGFGLVGVAARRRSPALAA